jgi:hypothetical protein
MNCQNCGAKTPDTAKFCPECGQRIMASHVSTGIEDSVVTRSPGSNSNLPTVISLSAKEPSISRCPNCDKELSIENKLLICLECGEKFCEKCERFYRYDRLRQEKPLCHQCHIALEEQQKKNNIHHYEINQIDILKADIISMIDNII